VNGVRLGRICQSRSDESENKLKGDLQALPGVDENSPKEMNVVMSVLKAFAADFETFMMLIHHTNQSGEGGGRGTNAAPAATDSVLEIKDSKGIKHIRVKKNKEGESGFNLRGSYFRR
jgi:hypothetical protein